MRLSGWLTVPPWPLPRLIASTCHAFDDAADDGVAAVEMRRLLDHDDVGINPADMREQVPA